MRHRREIKFGAWLLAAIAIAAGSYLFGSSLKPEEEPFYIFDTAAPAYGQAHAIAALSPAGFTGFGEVDESNSRTVVAGRVIEIGDGALTLESPSGHRTALSFGDAPAISRLLPGSADQLVPGSRVAVRLSPDGQTVEALLRISRP